MNKPELLKKINQINKQKYSVGLYLGHKDKKNYTFMKSIISDTVQKEIFELLIPTVLTVINNNDLVDFNPIGKQDETIELIDADEVEGYKTLVNDKTDKNNYAHNFEELREINFYLIEIKSNKDEIKIFRHYSKTKSLSKGIIFRSIASTLDKITDNVFQIDNIIDFIVINDSKIIVLNRYSFELITNYKDNYIENLDKALNEIRGSNLINNMEQFEEDCKSSMRIAKQFTKAMQESSISLLLNNMGAISEAIEEAELPIEFTNSKFQYENKEQLSILVALLSDKYAKTLIGKRITNS